MSPGENEASNHVAMIFLIHVVILVRTMSYLPMRDIFLAMRAHDGEVDYRISLPCDERRYLALARARQNIVKEQLFHPEAPRRVYGTAPELPVGVQIPAHVDRDLVLCCPLYRIQKLFWEFQSLPSLV